MSETTKAIGTPVDLVLGPLPEAATKGTFPGPHGYSCEQMRAYAAEQVAAERQRCITAAEDAYIAGKGAKGCIDAMRALCGPNRE